MFTDHASASDGLPAVPASVTISLRPQVASGCGSRRVFKLRGDSAAESSFTVQLQCGRLPPPSVPGTGWQVTSATWTDATRRVPLDVRG